VVIFNLRFTLASGLSAPTNNNDITKEYVDNLIPDLTNYLTTDMVHIPPTTTLPIDVSGITDNNPDDNLLVTKKYVDDLFNSLQNFLNTTNENFLLKNKEML
jgi:hypothetical protein